MKKPLIAAAILALAAISLTGCKIPTKTAADAETKPTPVPTMTTSTGEIITVDDAGMADLVKQRWGDCVAQLTPEGEPTYQRDKSELLPGSVTWKTASGDMIFLVKQGNGEGALLTFPFESTADYMDMVGCLG